MVKLAENKQNVLLPDGLSFSENKGPHMRIMMQWLPKKTGEEPGSEINFLGRRQLATEICFKVARWEKWSPKRFNKIFHLQRN